MTFYTPLPTPALKVDGILEGGGTLGTAYVGAMLALARNGVWFQRVIGNSAGAITASLVAAGYDANEIDWLCAPQGMRRLPNGKADRPPNLPPNVEPIDFMDFLDAPKTAAELDQSLKRQTILWHLLKGLFLEKMVDELTKIKIKTPPLDVYVNKLVGKVLDIIPDNIFGADPIPDSMEADIKRGVAKVLQGYPKELGLDPKLFEMAVALREKFADVVVDAVININTLTVSPFGVLWFQLTNRGGFCKGDKFYFTMRNLIEAKVKQLTKYSGQVTFQHLPIDLTMIASDTTNRKMLVYNKNLTSKMEVALAVRQSMSLPILFAPDRRGGKVIADGGLYENYPTWFYGAPTFSDYISQTPDDIKRPKFAMLLDEGMECPPEWKAPPPPFPDGADLWEVLLKDFKGAVTRGGDEKVNEEKIYSEIYMLKYVWDLISIQFGGGALDWTRKLVTDLARTLYPSFHEVVVPLYGFHLVDFTVNHEAATFNSIAFRGWRAAIQTLEAGQATLLPNTKTLIKTNPYAQASRGAASPRALKTNGKPSAAKTNGRANANGGSAANTNRKASATATSRKTSKKASASRRLK
ncbi:MAG TPA: patatin-like phospholipase family protein [Pyrinomonadaceae bacterium]|jgi:predicted acylesterase/phospholipase RssA